MMKKRGSVKDEGKLLNSAKTRAQFGNEKNNYTTGFNTAGGITETSMS
jgi:hypothetical protein|tara:strand:- start:924 stop:1067 length:144 start_codon:yes stop_codon:yes gene_type:complete